MYKVAPKDYMNYNQCIDKSCCGAVYPRSISETFQQGDIFTNSCTDNLSVLYWHYSGFAFLSGFYDECFLEDIYDLLLDKSSTISKRFILFTDNTAIEQFFRAKENVAIERRYFFEYKKEYPVITAKLPEGYRLCEINNELLQKINGKITPAFSWDNLNDFLEKGKGYCIVCGNDIAAWAFSAAISSDEIDIGIETDSKYRHLGFAQIVAQMMIRYCFEQHKAPVWACHAENTASINLAEKIGFVKSSECFTIQKAST